MLKNHCTILRMCRFPSSLMKQQHRRFSITQYWSKNQNLAQNRYYGSLFVGHCKNEDRHRNAMG